MQHFLFSMFVLIVLLLQLKKELVMFELSWQLVKCQRESGKGNVTVAI